MSIQEVYIVFTWPQMIPTIFQQKICCSKFVDSQWHVKDVYHKYNDHIGANTTRLKNNFEQNSFTSRTKNKKHILIKSQFNQTFYYRINSQDIDLEHIIMLNSNQENMIKIRSYHITRFYSHQYLPKCL